MATETPAQLAHPEFSKHYQPEFVEHYVAKIRGMEIPIDFGLTHRVINRSDNPILEVHLAEDIVPILGEIWLQSCWYRFTHLMTGNEDVTYGQYIALVKQGKGDIEFAVYDESASVSLRPVVMLIDPRDGFALSLVDTSLPIKINDIYSMYYGTDGTGRLFIAEKLDSAFLEKLYSQYNQYSPDFVWSLIFMSLYQRAFGDIVTTKDECLESENVLDACGLLSRPPEWDSINKPVRDEITGLGKGLRGPIFEVVTK